MLNIINYLIDHKKFILFKNIAIITINYSYYIDLSIYVVI